MTFEQWYAKVDEQFIAITGMDRDSWPDACYHDMFDDGMTPREAVTQAIYDEYGEAGCDAFGLESPW